MNKNINRREFIRRLGLGSAAVAGASLISCRRQDPSDVVKPGQGTMTYRVNPKDGSQVSILGYGCMRWPLTDEATGEIDQEMVNRLVDTALEHGVNYFDTSPAYCRGLSEKATGIALSRHPRDSYFIATKLSNFAPATWPREQSIAMFENSLRQLQTDHIDYLLLHAIGGSATDLDGRHLDAMQTFNARYIDNGILDYLLEQRDKGVIRNLGFSYHGDIAVFDHLLANHDKYNWDFVQIQLNYVDWLHANSSEGNTNAEYLYGELRSRGIPAVIMEPLLGGRLASLPAPSAARLKQLRPDDSIASWAFRYAGTPEGVLTVLSGMTYMEHLQDNLRSYSPLNPCSPEEIETLHHIAYSYVNQHFVPCTRCQYCMPCPYGVDIPGNFAHYNKCVNEGNYGLELTDPEYAKARRAYLLSYDRDLPKIRRADHCIACRQCVEHCPQCIDIPAELQRIDQYIDNLRHNA